MRNISLCLLTFAALCLTQWAYAQPPGGGRDHGRAPVIRGQAEPAPHHAPKFDPRRDFDRVPPRYVPPPPHHRPAPHHAPPPPHYRPARHPAPPPPPEPYGRSFLQVVLPFLSIGLSR
ncbi:MAG: hypothetical protein IKE69_05920 [Thermoguttaceae bacterium]|nr:hypothetical protein [Thermoguttaceae bacterium]